MHYIYHKIENLCTTNIAVIIYKEILVISFKTNIYLIKTLIIL